MKLKLITAALSTFVMATSLMAQVESKNIYKNGFLGAEEDGSFCVVASQGVSLSTPGRYTLVGLDLNYQEGGDEVYFKMSMGGSNLNGKSSFAGKVDLGGDLGLSNRAFIGAGILKIDNNIESYSASLFPVYLGYRDRFMKIKAGVTPQSTFMDSEIAASIHEDAYLAGTGPSLFANGKFRLGKHVMLELGYERIKLNNMDSEMIISDTKTTQEIILNDDNVYQEITTEIRDQLAPQYDMISESGKVCVFNAELSARIGKRFVGNVGVKNTRGQYSIQAENMDGSKGEIKNVNTNNLMLNFGLIIDLFE